MFIGTENGILHLQNQLKTRQVELSKDLNGWKPVTQSKQIRYGEWTTNAPIGQVGTGGGWGNWGTSVVWEDYKTVTSNEFERASLNNEIKNLGDKGSSKPKLIKFTRNLY